MSGRYLIRLTPPSPPPSSTSAHQSSNNQQQQRPSDLLSSLQSLRTGFAAGQHVDQTAAITRNSVAPAVPGSAAVLVSSGPAQDSWTLRLDRCQEPRRSWWDAGAAGSSHATTPSGGAVANAALPLARSSFYLPADRLLILSVKWFTLGRCLLGLMQGAAQSLILDSFFSSAQTGRNLLAYPSDAHSQTRLMVAACVTVRVLSALDWSSLPVSLALTPTPRVELQCRDDE